MPGNTDDTQRNARDADRGDWQGAPDSISADLRRTLLSVAFPADKAQLVAAAREANASNDALTFLGGLPEQDYVDADAVFAGLAAK
ncbi:MAG: DUF2795 domain-containing protein [Janthinobacterium lividum]